MASFRDSILPAIDAIRAIRGPTGLDVQTVQLTVRTRAWDGDRAGQGDPVDTDLVLPQRYKVRQVTAKEIADSNGKYQMGDWIVGPITLAYQGGGFSLSQLDPDGSTGTEVMHILSGAINAECKLINVNSERPFRYMLTLRNTRTTP